MIPWIAQLYWLMKEDKIFINTELLSEMIAGELTLLNRRLENIINAIRARLAVIQGSVKILQN